MRKRIIITLSHDIRGPLNAIRGSAEPAMDTKDRKRRNSYLNNILSSTGHTHIDIRNTRITEKQKETL